MPDILPSFSDTLKQHGLTLERKQSQILQVNMGRLCNQACHHCHLCAGPDKNETMDRKTMSEVIDFQHRCAFKVVDITGGAPEMNPDLPYFIEKICEITSSVMFRSNLSALLESGQEHLIPILKKNRVTIVSSFPSLNQTQTDSQRGNGIFEKSIKALILLNEYGYGRKGTGLELNLVSNPAGAYLPSPQKSTEKRYREVLLKKWGITFNNAFTFANMPLGRFEDWLKRSGNYDSYLCDLYKNFNPFTVADLMCRNLISVSFDGYLFDCDFNLAAGLPKGNKKLHISEIATCYFEADKIALDNHCYACTAGSGFT